MSYRKKIDKSTEDRKPTLWICTGVGLLFLCIFLFVSFRNTVDDVGDSQGAVRQEVENDEGVEEGEEESPTNWIKYVAKSPMDDSTTYLFCCDATKGEGILNEKPILYVRRMEGASNVFISYPRYVGSEKVMVMARFGSDEPITTEWELSSDGKSLIMPWSVGEVIDALCQSDTLVVRFETYMGEFKTITFNVFGFGPIIAPVRDKFVNPATDD